MPIVLAIEPDRRQAAHLTAIVRHQVGAELLLADTTEGALDAIGDRIPDLVLVPALLSPQDDAALAAALRVIAAAAHVRTLTIPVLANGTARAAGGGMLAKWRKVRAASPEPDGCDPAVFGEQISTYLREAAAERAQLEDDLLTEPMAALAPPATAPRIEPIAIEEAWVERIAVEEIWVKPIAVEEAWAEPIATLESVASLTATDLVEQVDAIEAIEETRELVEEAGAIEDAAVESIPVWAVQPMSERLDQELDEPDEVDESLIDLSGQLEDLPEEIGGDLFDGEPVSVYTIGDQVGEPQLDTLDLLPAILEPANTSFAARAAAPIEIELVEAEAVESEPFEAEPLVAEALFSISPVAEPPIGVRMFAESLFVEPPEPPHADIKPWVPMYLTPGRMWPVLEGMPAEVPAPRTEQPDWIELVASLRQDLERRRTDPAATVDPIVVRPSDGAQAAPHQLVKKPRVQTRKARPVQDEWGFFDPEQCGFSTLLAKLEEITEDSRP